jgi:NitT/TauT family transport system permease protein
MTVAGATETAPMSPQARPLRRAGQYFLRHPGAARFGIVVAAILLWEIAGHTILDPAFLSSPSAILRAAPRVLSETGIQWALWASLYELVIAFAMSVVAGVIIGLPIGLNRFSLRSVLPLVLLLYSIPQVTILPLFVLYFGIGAGSKIAFGFSHGIFPIILNVIAGVQSVDEAHLTAARSMGATRLQTIMRVVLPTMTPSLFAGLRLAMSATLLGVLLAELYVSTGGVGHYTRLFTDSFDPPATFTLVTALALMALILNETVRRAERRASFWRAHQR